MKSDTQHMYTYSRVIYHRNENSKLSVLGDKELTKPTIKLDCWQIIIVWLIFQGTIISSKTK